MLFIQLKINSQQLLNFSLTLVEKRIIYLCHMVDKNFVGLWGAI